MSKTINNLWKTYETVNSWIKFSDTKAGAIIVINGSAASIIATIIMSAKKCLFDNYPFVIGSTLFLGTIAGIFSAYYAFKALNPDTKPRESDSLIFFRNIAGKFKTSKDYEQKIKKVFNDKDRITNQLSEQIWINSRIARQKYKNVTKALYYLIGVLICSLIILGIMI